MHRCSTSIGKGVNVAILVIALLTWVRDQYCWVQYLLRHKRHIEITI